MGPKKNVKKKARKRKVSGASLLRKQGFRFYSSYVVRCLRDPVAQLPTNSPWAVRLDL